MTTLAFLTLAFFTDLLITLIAAIIDAKREIFGRLSWGITPRCARVTIKRMIAEDRASRLLRELDR
jgi:hypothetical protein